MCYRHILPFTLMVALVSTLFLVPGAHGEALDCLIEPYVIVNISSAVGGLLETVRVDRGDLVKKGQILASLEADVEKVSVAVFHARATMESTIQASEVRFELSVRQHSRNQGMFKKALIAADEMDEAKTTRQLAELALREAMDARYLAELELRRAKAELARRTIRSPITGFVVDRFLSPGEFASEDPFLQLAQINPLRVEVFVPVTLLGKVAVGMQAEVIPQEPVKGVYKARVTVVDRVVDTASGTFGVHLEIANRDYRLPAGLRCTLRFLHE